MDINRQPVLPRHLKSLFFGLIFLLGDFLSPPPAEAMIGVEVMTQKSLWTLDPLSIQKSIVQSGSYLYLPLGSLAYVEGAQEQLELSYKGGLLAPLKQGDRSAVFNLLLGPMMLSAGVHQVQSTNSQVDGGRSKAYQFSLPEIFHLSLGYARFETTFPNHSLTDTPTKKGLVIKQQSPEVGFSFFEGSLGFRAARTTARFSDSLGRNKTLFQSNQLTSTLWLQPFYFSYSSWTGQRLYFANNKGLYLNSLSQVYHGGSQASVTWMPAMWIDLSLNRSYDLFEETGFVAPLKARTDTLSLTLRF